MVKYQKEIFIATVLIVLGLVAYAMLSLGTQQTIVPFAGIGGVSIYTQGETVHWRVALNAQDGIPLFTSLGCNNAASYTPVTVSAMTSLICNGDTIATTGSLLYAPSSSCNVFQGTSAAIAFNGEASATIPSTATSCYISNLFTANRNDAPSVFKQRTDSTNTGTLALQTLPTCVTGERRCFGAQPKVCTNNQWQQSDVCSNGCSNGYCIRVCTTGATQCYGSLTQVCNSAGEWGFDYSKNICSTIPPPTVDKCSDGTSHNACSASRIGYVCGSYTNGGTWELIFSPTLCGGGEVCSDGSVKPIGECASTEWCGDAICNNGENSASCLGDCPITPIPEPEPTPQPEPTPIIMPLPSIFDLGEWLKANWLIAVIGVLFVGLAAVIVYFMAKKR